MFLVGIDLGGNNRVPIKVSLPYKQTGICTLLCNIWNIIRPLYRRKTTTYVQLHKVLRTYKIISAERSNRGCMGIAKEILLQVIFPVADYPILGKGIDKDIILYLDIITLIY